MLKQGFTVVSACWSACVPYLSTALVGAAPFLVSVKGRQACDVAISHGFHHGILCVCRMRGRMELLIQNGIVELNPGIEQRSADTSVTAFALGVQ